MRRIVTFSCEGDTLYGTVDEAAGATGLLIVSGGNEVRCGAHRGMALLAEGLVASGVPVFRFDRRGVGDSEGENLGYAASAPDIAAALAAFRREQPHVTRVVGFGNCDAATALVLFGAAFDDLVLANPWLGDEQAALPPSALRAHYARRLRDPAAWLGLFRRLSKRIGDLRTMFGTVPEQPLSAQLIKALGSHNAMVILASGDRTAQVFATSVTLPSHVETVAIDTASHSFVRQGDALQRVIQERLERVASNRDPLR